MSMASMGDLGSTGGGVAVTKTCTDLLTFESSETLLRGVPLSRVTVSFGRILGNSRGSADTYKWSRPVKQIHTFVSHNWTTPRLSKWWALVAHFYLDDVLVIMIAFLLLCGTLTAAGCLPTYWDKGFDEPTGFLTRVFFVPFLFAAVVVRSEVIGPLAVRFPLVFLDKICIHQTDVGKMQQGISKLGAFIGHSRRFLVIYTDLYTRKLWTVYEVAAFLSLHPVEDLDVMPIMHSGFFFRMLFALWVLAAPTPLVKAFLVVDVYSYVGLLAAVTVYVSLTRRHAVEVRKVLAQLSTFSCRACMCAVESDRPLVYANIARLMQMKGVVGPGADEAQALDTFDALVRRTLPEAFKTAFGRTCFSYKVYAIAGLASAGTSSADYMASADWSRMSVVMILRELLMTFTVTPLAVLLIERLACWRLDWTGLRSWCVQAASVLLGVAVPYGCILALRHWRNAAGHSDVALASLAVALALGPLIPYAICARGPLCRRARRPAGSSTSEVSLTPCKIDSAASDDSGHREQLEATDQDGTNSELTVYDV